MPEIADMHGAEEAAAQPRQPEPEPAGVLEQCERTAQRIRSALGDQLRSAEGPDDTDSPQNSIGLHLRLPSCSNVPLMLNTVTFHQWGIEAAADQLQRCGQPGGGAGGSCGGGFGVAGCGVRRPVWQPEALPGAYKQSRRLVKGKQSTEIRHHQMPKACLE